MRRLRSRDVIYDALRGQAIFALGEKMTDRSEDLRFATNEERRYALAYLRWLAGGPKRRETEPSATHPTYGLTAGRGERIRSDIEALVLDAAKHLQRQS